MKTFWWPAACLWEWSDSPAVSSRPPACSRSDPPRPPRVVTSSAPPLPLQVTSPLHQLLAAASPVTSSARQHTPGSAARSPMSCSGRWNCCSHSCCCCCCRWLLEVLHQPCQLPTRCRSPCPQLRQPRLRQHCSWLPLRGSTWPEERLRQ